MPRRLPIELDRPLVEPGHVGIARLIENDLKRGEAIHRRIAVCPCAGRRVAEIQGGDVLDLEIQVERVVDRREAAVDAARGGHLILGELTGIRNALR